MKKDYDIWYRTLKAVEPEAYCKAIVYAEGVSLTNALDTELAAQIEAACVMLACELLDVKPSPSLPMPRSHIAAAEAAERGEGMGYALAMRVLQSDLYQQLDDLERGECDALIRAGQQTMLTAAEERKDG